MLPRNKKIGLLLLGLVFYLVSSEIVVVSALQCSHCEGDDCDDPIVRDCTNETDQCYIRLDDTLNFIGMGCASTLGNETEIANLIRNKELYVCSTANCNDFENLPAINDCTACDSSTDVRCAIQPTTAGTTRRCATVPFTQCYERVNIANGGTTERGCLIELEGDDFYDCLSEEGENCKVCTGSGCNTEIVPANRQQCQRCDSDTDSTCSSLPSALSTCPTYDVNDTCVSVYESGVTRRGCASEFTCDATARNCEVCSANGCNTANVKKRAEELYGIFQDLPLNCYTCVDEDCETSKGLLRKCLGDLYQDCLTVFDAAGKVLQRGCEASISAEHQSHCATNPSLCFNCKSNGCNNQTEVKTKEQCLYCDSAVNADCATNIEAITSTRECVDGCVTALYERESKPNVYDLARTCFEDVEFDDRETCTAANNCVQCTGEKCNTALVPAEGRLSCLHCNGDDCDSPVASVCSTYSASDQCYIFFDNVTYSAVRMGCKSSLPAGAIYEDIMHYFLCDGDDCNDYDNLPEAHICYVCDSATDVNCAISPSAITNQVRCQIHPHTDCFTRISDDGRTVRGCISTLNSTEFLSCHEGTPGEYCRICAQSNCNVNIYPSNRQRCYRCNSLDDPECANNPDNSTYSACPLYDSNDVCVSKLIGGIVYRGCGTELQCDGGINSKTCRSCDDSYCNDYIFTEYPIGDPGIFQELPLNCYNCNGTEECSGSLGNVRKCLNNDYQTCTSVFNATNGQVIGRGCSDTWAETCADDDHQCYDCKSNGCNVATTTDDYIECIFCDAQFDENCLTDVSKIVQTRACYKSCVTTLYNRTNDDTPVRELIRTCLDDMDLDDREICADDKDENCKACNYEYCNTDVVGERISCYQCMGDECQSPVAKTCRAVTEGDQCFVEYDETRSIVEMGCKSKYDPAEVKELIIAKRLWLCDGENCNTIDATPVSQTCTICNSITDADCAIAPQTVTSQTTCARSPYTQCYSRVLSDGHTERGCLSSIEGEDFYDCLLGGNTTNCLACVGSGCNSAIYPANRLSCHQCSSEGSSQCESKPDDAYLCLKYSESQQCVSTIDDSGYTVRGCSLEVACGSDVCESCSGDDCNVSNIKRKLSGRPGQWQELPLTCKVCEGKSDCAGTPTELVCTGTNDYCMTVFDEDDSVLARGCSSGIEAEHGTYCDVNADKCQNCNSNNCNTVSALTDYIDCIYCDSATNANCVSHPENVSEWRKCNTYCMTALRPRKASPEIFDLSRSCLDDKEAADQLICREGSSDCVACQGAACNTAVLPANRRSCYTCEGEDCVTPETAACTAYTENEQCYVLFDDLSDVQRMGCVSDLDSAYIAENEHLLLRCSDGDNCNSFESFPKPITCYQCDSEDDESCASAPSAIQTLATCAALPNVDCYTRVIADGSTQRGCVSTLAKTELLSCLSGNASLCQTCNDSLCNKEVFPQDRRSCQRCNSKDDATCQSSPNAASVCPTYNEDEFCATKLVNGYIYRGCSSEFQCDVTNKLYCRHCNSDNCNTVDLTNLSSLDIGEPGKWQDLPLTCYDCQGDDCSNSAGTLHECENNNLQTCQTVFGADGAVVRRGCSDDVLATHEEYCEDNAGKCLGCKSNNCNNATSLDQYVDCYACDSATDAQCALDFVAANSTQRPCQGHCAVALYPRSSSENPSYELARTCLDDLELDDREKCLAGEHELCVACEGALCNTASLPANRHKCYTCVDNECTDYKVAECSAYQPNDQCYISFDAENSIFGMGCRSDLESDVITALIKQKVLLLCDGEACNGVESIPTAKTCSVCDSESDERCATNPNLVADTERCSNLPYTNCYTRVKENGHTARGCLSNLSEDTFYNCLYDNSTLCETCVGDKCNGLDVYPTGRWQCQQCSSETDPLCTSTPNSNKICPIYAENDGCVTNLRDGITTRGCASSMSCDDESDRKTCRICTTSGCNTVDLEKSLEQGEPGRWQDVPITCRTCEGVEDCESLGNYRVCTSNLYQSCMTVFNTNGNVIQRGCSDAVEENNSALCSEYPENCLRCNSNGCNNSTRLADYIECIYCDTDSDANCLNNLSAVTQTRKCNTYCTTALYPKYDEVNPAYALARTCFDDLEYDDRVACAAGQKEHCQVCAEAKCNTQSVPETRLSCNVCKGDDCQDPQPQSCAAYREGDQCYIQFDEERSIVGFGCRSEFTNAEADYLLQNKRLFYCDGDNCNTFDALPEAQYCKLCNSRTDLNCATNPNSVTATTRCAYLPYTECYTRILDGGVTERGCLSSLYDDDFGSCLNGTAPYCQACKGDSCNNELYPEERLSCHICDSLTDPTCTNKPDSVSVCPLYVAGDTCVTAYSDDVTYRGCSSSVRCDASQPRSCWQCEGAACNTINLSRRQDDNYGKWQDLPLSCLTCNGTSCAAVSDVESVTCANNNEQDCVTVFQSGAVVRRGCADAVEEEYGDYCDANPDDCLNCKSNSCNNATALTQYNECIYCDTQKNLSCLWSPESSAHKTRQCQGGCMTALYPSDSSSDPGYELIRTCLDDKEAADRANCNDDQCQSCVGSKCNSATVPAERLSCYQCAGDDCDEPELKLCPLYKSEDNCFTWFDETNSVSQMGCVSSFHNQEISTIISTKRVLVCEGDACNSLNDLPRPQQCAVCDSATDYTCATNAQEISTFNTCNVYPYTNCYTKLISTDGSTTRGCLSDLPATEFVDCVLGNDKNCSICIGEGCNREVFPEDRQLCYTCSSEDDDSCQSNPTRLLACPFVTETEKCRTAVSNNITIRGCSSEILCDLNDRNCVSCNGSACNSIDLLNRAEDDGVHGLWQELPLRCHTCEGEHCLQSLGPAYQCTGNTAQDCATVFTTDGDVKRRGCFDDVEIYEQRYCRENPHLCFSCKSNECNDVWNTTDYIECNFCTSDTNPLCSTDPQNANFTKRACNKECMVAIKGSQVIRSCLDDKELYHRNECRGDSDECSSCSTPNCNDFVYPEIPESDFSCHVCNDASCLTSVSQSCANATNDYCFAKYENGRPELLGCASSQSQSDLTAWEAEKKLYTCTEKDCNILSNLPTTGVQCVSCNSELTPACAQNPTAVTATASCPALQTQCVTNLNNAGHTLRGCLSDLAQSDQAACVVNGTCSICIGDKCNNVLYPSNRLRCHICISSVDESCSKEPNHLQVCPIYSSTDQCVTRHDTYTERGCKSQITCDVSDGQTCNICSGDGCNTVELTGGATVLSTVSLLTTLVFAIVAMLVIT
ncbi:uncharacterized protein LOC105222439 [Bactrocera dorsalis]|uniref:Uncharacterized protein LOC105222439 n=1 Tax=Bactrocera dorsalis TaxID=27457 RepID=A0ABM3JBQ5_BACDO|nr:uncharacterized protein LOC105222439 [Bactrocera dorsalis]